jgi:nucleoside-diphosphate-sugar epimerase
MRGYAEAVASWFGSEARLEFLPWERWKEGRSEQEIRATWDHISHSPNCSIEKAKRVLGYAPRYTSLEAVREAVLWLRDRDMLR